MRHTKQWTIATLVLAACTASALVSPVALDLATELDRQYEQLQQDLDRRPHFKKVAAESFDPAALVSVEDRDPADIVLRRTAALLENLLQPGGKEVGDLAERLGLLQQRGTSIPVSDQTARRALHDEVCALRRELAFQNPLLTFTDILFIKRHRAAYNHMCDQYYGMAAVPGGGLYVLKDAFGTTPGLHDVLADAVVEQGRLKGRTLTGGSVERPPVRFDGQGNRHGEDGDGGTFLSPDLSYDGRTVLFSYAECEGDTRHRHHTDPQQGHWDPGRCYHLFKVGLDGSGLEQITDGTWNDLDPCWLPNGRVAFISERRGGYLRCGRVCPLYTLYDVEPDGSDISCLSVHESNEWHPSVTHDGQIIWTRWDYVDRHGCIAHAPWITTLDGRNPRPLHGNYAPRPGRPDMELDVRSIPGSRKFIATAAPHHGQAFGSLVLLDPDVPDDDGMGPIKRLTPEVSFPESQGGREIYGTAWPLSEQFYLCVADAAMTRKGRGGRGDYGIYLVDAFGNRELLYRDPAISCLSPIPVQARAVPAWSPEVARRGPDVDPSTRPTQDVGPQTPEATVSVANVYDSLLPWPEGTTITALRVLQVMPMSVPSGRPPHETGLRVASAGDSVVPVRHVLGTVPVEEDGSAHFRVPANREIFFQALDEQGRAVQSMRSATHAREGEHLSCTGCHEPKQFASPTLPVVPTALARAPSQLEPEVEGTRPFSYPLLVQPVLDKHCVGCHQKHPKKAPNLAREPVNRGWYASYNSLVRDFGFHDYGDGYRTTPGRFGARASKLLALLEKGHHDLELPREDLHRLVLWLDCSSMFYGVYEKEGGLAQLRGELASPTLQ